MFRRLFILFLVTLMAGLFAIPALAGGWTVITLDEYPQDVRAGEPVTIGFMVRQHGVTPLDGETPLIRFVNAEDGQKLTVKAGQDGPTGHYVAEFSLPTAGSWEWSVETFGPIQPMPPLVVAAPLVGASPEQNTDTQSERLFNRMERWSMVLGFSGIGLAGLALTLALRRRSRWAIAAVVLGLLVGAAGFARAGIRPVSASPPASSEPVPEAAPASSRQIGEALFIAKGCLSCHNNNRVDDRFFGSRTGQGPDLTAYKTSSEFLNLWLADPVSVKPKTKMPNLQLTQEEIEALIAFILAQPG